jgi:hypothetical protein
MSRPQLQASDQARTEVQRCSCRCLGVRLGDSIHLDIQEARDGRAVVVVNEATGKEVEGSHCFQRPDWEVGLREVGEGLEGQVFVADRMCQRIE